ncbi:MAG: hypothetical protein AB1651_17150 [Pseudomonadota bacterium]|jgi:hypothetical protein
MATLLAVASALNRIDFNAVPQIRQLLGTWPLPDIVVRLAAATAKPAFACGCKALL